MLSGGRKFLFHLIYCCMNNGSRPKKTLYEIIVATEFYKRKKHVKNLLNYIVTVEC